MERFLDKADGSASWRWHHKLWQLALLLLLVWQAGLTLSLFGSAPLSALCDDQPLLSGSHPRDLYLGARGTQALVKHGRTCVYDDAFQVGYPITPIFNGSRLAELFLLLGGGSYQPAAYKIGVAGTCLLVPILLIVACRGAGLGLPATVLATFLGQLVWWGPLGRSALEAGEAEIYLASLAGVAHVGLLLAFHRTSSVFAWLGLFVTGALGCFLQPLMIPLALPLLLAYYLSVGVKHDFLTWHMAFWSVEAGAVLVNLWWLLDWAGYWWLRAPLPTATALLTHRTLATVWHAPLWGGPADRVLIFFLMVSAAVGVVVLNQSGQRPAARLLGLGAAGAFVLALLGISWEPLGVVGTAALLTPALWFAALPAAHVWVWIVSRLWSYNATTRVATLLILTALPLPFLACPEITQCYLGRCTDPRPLTLGLNAERHALVETLSRVTNTDARILWEDRAVERESSRWTALLPLLTGRRFVGGLDPEGFLEHSEIGLLSASAEAKSSFAWTNKKPLARWKEDRKENRTNLQTYCRQYNIGWVVAWSPEVIALLRDWDGAEALQTVVDGTEGVLFRIRRTNPSYCLHGKAELLRSDNGSIVLANVEPENGVVVLSLHYQTGMHASPGRVHVEREQRGDDPIGLLRLHLASPAARVTLTWDR